MPYGYDEYGGGPSKKYMEGAIPLIILILIGVVILGRMGLLAGVPVIGGLFGHRQEVHIAVIGSLDSTGVSTPTSIDASILKTYLDSSRAMALGYHYVEFQPDTAEYAGEELLSEFDLVILAGEKEFSRPVKSAIGTYIKGGGKLVIIGDAAINDPQDPLQIGWQVAEMQGTFPVAIQYDVTKEQLENPEVIANIPDVQPLTLSFVSIRHPIYERAGYPLHTVFDDAEGRIDVKCISTVPAIPVRPDGAGIVAVLKGTRMVDPEPEIEDVTPITRLAIAEKETGFGRGHVVYFSYDPGCTPGIWDATVDHMLRR